MRALFYVFLAGTLGLLSSCNDSKTKTATEEQTAQTTTMSYSDPHSYSNAEQTNPTHLDLELKVDFEQQQIIGHAKWTIKADAGVDEIIFDTRNLQIDSVLYANGQKAPFSLGKKDEILGEALHITLEENTESISVYYKTLEDATALQWLEAGQTFGKKHPFLYTQSESIHVRTWIPGPDSPGARYTYTAKVEVPEGLMALMSAENPTEISANGIYTFEMNEAIPGYLVALAVGDVVFEALDERTGVYAEPAIIKEAVYEMGEVPSMVAAAEAIYGKYRWGRYDVLFLPSGFPIGGMENPKLTFATPTILAGDRSLTNLIAHELAHSWSGNLVTNATWNDFWLNEGFTTYFEHRIMEATKGQDYSDMVWSLSERTLRESVADMGQSNPDTRLRVDMEGRDPDDGFTYIPYEKGAAFLLLMEQTVGREKWDNFLNTYFDTHAFQVMTTDYFLNYLDENLLSENPAWKDEIRVDEWVFQAGIPDNYPSRENKIFDALDELIQNVISDKTKISAIDASNWSTQEWMHFIGALPKDLSLEKMQALDNAFDLTQSKNAEIADLWYELALHTNYTAAYDAMKEFLYVTGREKFLEPLYKQMMTSAEGKAMAYDIYKKARPNYHPLTQKFMDEILEWEQN